MFAAERFRPVQPLNRFHAALHPANRAGVGGSEAGRRKPHAVQIAVLFVCDAPDIFADSLYPNIADGGAVFGRERGFFKNNALPR